MREGVRGRRRTWCDSVGTASVLRGHVDEPAKGIRRTLQAFGAMHGVQVGGLRTCFLSVPGSLSSLRGSISFLVALSHGLRRGFILLPLRG